jgi:hypothetical protein
MSTKSFHAGDSAVAGGLSSPDLFVRSETAVTQSSGVVWTVLLSGFDSIPEQDVALLQSALVVSRNNLARCSY